MSTDNTFREIFGSRIFKLMNQISRYIKQPHAEQIVYENVFPAFRDAVIIHFRIHFIDISRSIFRSASEYAHIGIQLSQRLRIITLRIIFRQNTSECIDSIHSPALSVQPGSFIRNGIRIFIFKFGIL